HSFGTIELLTRLPMTINAGLIQDLINFIITCLVFFAVSYFVFNFLIKKMNLTTPDRRRNYTDEDTEEEAEEQNGAKAENAAAIEIVQMLGGSENIAEVDACMTRLRVTVNDAEKVASEANWKSACALGLVLRDRGVQA